MVLMRFHRFHNPWGELDPSRQLHSPRSAGTGTIKTARACPDANKCKCAFAWSVVGYPFLNLYPSQPPWAASMLPENFVFFLAFCHLFQSALPMCLSSRTTSSDRPDVDYSIIIAAFQEFVLNMEAVKRNYYWTLFNSTKLEA